MQSSLMQSEDYGDMARQFLRGADANFVLDEYLTGAQRMWDAAAYSVMAVCRHRNWPHQSRRETSIYRSRDWPLN